jgi:lysozyme
MNTGAKGLQLIKDSEAFVPHPYLCPAGIPTIGYGSTYYPNGKRVTMQDAPITEDTATMLLLNLLHPIELFVDANTTDLVNQNQFDALVDFAYNCGNANLKSSTLLKKVNANPNDKTIADEFLKWDKAMVDGHLVELQGLKTRRQKEADLYFEAH